MGSDPTLPLRGRKLIVGVCGGIAAYKAAELVRSCRRAGADVQVLMTPHAARFIAPLTLATLSGHDVPIEVFPEEDSGSWTKHIELGLWADLFVIAPATAQTMAKLAYGFADSMLTATALAARCPILLCPAMDHDMYVHPATRSNRDRLREFGYELMDASYGELASGLTGFGRLPEPSEILDRIVRLLEQKRPEKTTAFTGRQVLVTAGPTREPFDPVRFISNPSTGTMGYALAQEAAARGAAVTLVSGPTGLPAPPGITRVDVTTAAEMHEAVLRHRTAGLVIMAAAVADYRPVEQATSKMKKSGSEMTVRLVPTPDILAGLGASKLPGQVLVGFAMETDDVLDHAREKLERKNLDLIVANDLHEPGAGFGMETNRVTLLYRDGRVESLPLQDKRAVARAILDRLAGLLAPEETDEIAGSA